MFMKICCGTNTPKKEEIDLDSYSPSHRTTITIGEMQEACHIFDELMNSPIFADDHHRNRCAVNGCIALHVLGYNARDWFDAFCEDQITNHPGRFFTADLRKFMEHVERVAPYLDDWGPKGNKGQALHFCV